MIFFFYNLWIPNPSPYIDSIGNNFDSILDHLLEWSKKKYGNLPLRINQIKQKLNSIRSQSSWTTSEEAKFKLEIDQLLSQEDFWKTRSREDWLTERDRNTTYFHRKAFQRHK